MPRPDSEEDLHMLALSAFDERLSRYRLQNRQAEQLMMASLQRYGQLSPIVVCPEQDERWLLIDGFKRLRAARQLKGHDQLLARRIELDEAGAKAALYNLNCHTSRPQELEESWIVRALVRDDGLSQVEVGQLLGRHKSWVNRRLAMLERLAEPALEELRLGLLPISLARQLVRLPVGNQAEALGTAREASLTSVELRGVVDLLLASGSQEQKQFVLREPRRALRQADDSFVHVWDARLSSAGNRAARHLAQLLDRLAKMNSWLRYHGRSSLMACDREPLHSGFQRLARETRLVAEATDDFLLQLKLT